MKKTVMTIAIVLGLAIGATAQGGGLFERGDMPKMTENGYRGGEPMLPAEHGMPTDQPATSPLDGGMALLFGMAVMYFARKKGSRD